MINIKSNLKVKLVFKIKLTYSLIVKQKINKAKKHIAIDLPCFTKLITLQGECIFQKNLIHHYCVLMLK